MNLLGWLQERAAVARAEPRWYRRLGLAGGWAWPLAAFVASVLGGASVEAIRVALPEELLFRGVVQGELLRRTRHPLAAPVLAAAAFALAHVALGRGVGGLLTFFPGLLFGLLRLVSGSIWPAVAAHAIANQWWVGATL